MTDAPARVNAWLAALHDRHTAHLRPQEFTRAVRALSARYVEARATIADRSPLDSPGKRAAFGFFYSALHFLVVSEIARALDLASAPIDTITDLGCGTGVASAAWALAVDTTPALAGIDKNAWALDEARWNWRTLGLNGRATRGDLIDAADSLTTSRSSARPGAIAGWSVNELPAAARPGLLAALLAFHDRGGAVLIVEPIARRAVPWWPDWAAAFTRGGGRADEWKFDVALPPLVARVDESAGFRRDVLSARSLWLGPKIGP